MPTTEVAMRVRIAITFVLLCAALLPSAAAGVPCPPLQCGPSATAVADGRLLAVAAGRGHSLSIYDFATGKLRSVITGGVASADGTRAAGQEGQLLRTYDLARARVVARTKLGAGWSLAGLSADGGRTVLVRGGGTTKTEFAVRGAQPASILLNGLFDFDGLLGNRLYLIQQQQNGYLVRVADLATGKLDAEPLKDADEPALIRGFAWSRLASPDGRYVFTLYIDAGKGDVMIHQLDMRAGTARCIDLPGNGDFVSSGSYALALSRDGGTLYAASGANGTVVTVDVASQRVTKVAHVDKEAVNVSTGQLLPSASLSRDGGTLAFAVNGALWVYDLDRDAVVRRSTIAAGAVAYSRAGALWVVGTDGVLRRVRT
jgi:hypothetical protein